jgi:transmembrane sensor
VFLDASFEQSGGSWSALLQRFKAVAGAPRILRGTFIAASVATLVLSVVPGAMWLGGARSVSMALADFVAQLLDLRREQVVSTRVGELKTIAAAPGLNVTLNTATTAHFTSSKRKERVRLELGGEVLVNASSTVEKNVRVVAGPIAVEPAGSEFTVRYERDGTCSVHVVAGLATLRAVGYDGVGMEQASFQPVSLPAGRQAVFRRGRLVLSSFPQEDAERVVAWSSGYLLFKDDSLGKVVAEFNRYNYQQFVIIEPAIASRRIGGTFRATNVEAFAWHLQRLLDVRTVSYRAGGRRANVILLMGAQHAKA